MSKALKLQELISATPKSCAALNAEYLRHTTFDDAALRCEILDLFRSHLAAFRTKLQYPVDSENWRYLTHGLKGAAAAIGAEQFAAAAAEWDRQPAPSTEAALRTVQSQFEALRHDFDRALAALQD